MLLSTALLVQALAILFITGILYGFSDFIMRGLDRSSAKSAIAVMQNINVTVYKSLFMIFFVALVLMAVVTSIWSVITLDWSGSVYTVTGALLYIFGMFMVTGLGNVPLNESLKRVNSDQADLDQIWMNYYVRWTRLNTLRCIFGVLASISLVTAAYMASSLR